MKLRSDHFGSKRGKRCAAVLITLLGVSPIAEVLAQTVSNDLSGVAFHPLMANEAPSSEVNKANDEMAAHVRESFEGGTYCKAGVCINVPPLPTSPLTEVTDYAAELEFGAYVATSRKMNACTDAICAEQVVEQAGGVTRIAPQDTP